jgi:hypothetical protein
VREKRFSLPRRAFCPKKYDRSPIMMRKTVLFGMRSQIFALMCSLLLFSPALPADSVWEGSAAVSRYNEFPDTGFYGASNSFPRNTTVNVENLENGRKVRLIITGRVSDPALFILVSKEAASALGIPSGRSSEPASSSRRRQRLRTMYVPTILRSTRTRNQSRDDR